MSASSCLALSSTGTKATLLAAVLLLLALSLVLLVAGYSVLATRTGSTLPYPLVKDSLLKGCQKRPS